LGKRGTGPEGLPNSIIVTPEGIEGEVPVAEEVAASIGGEEAIPASDNKPPMLIEEEDAGREATKPLKAQGKARPDRLPKGKKALTKADQLPLFAAQGSPEKKAAERVKKPLKTQRGRQSGRRKT
jgi:DNA topoisomerase VI subunit B